MKYVDSECFAGTFTMNSLVFTAAVVQKTFVQKHLQTTPHLMLQFEPFLTQFKKPNFLAVKKLHFV